MLKSAALGPLTLRTELEQWPFREPFRITGYSWHHIDVLVVSLEKNGVIGRGEAAGVYYKSDVPAAMLKQLQALKSVIETGLSRESVQALLPPGGARNALDCAVWDLEAKLTGAPAWQIAGISTPQPILTTFTCGADSPEKMAATALAYATARAIKVKLTGEAVDADRVRAIRAARPDVWLGVDANQGFTRASLEALMPVLVECRVALIEQPLRVGEEAQLDGFQSPIPIAADESVQSLADVAALRGRFDMMNIKLDKCGGLTEALAMAHRARELGLGVMVGNMMGTSLAMAPAFLVGQRCNVVDLDGPVFLKRDREPAVTYAEGRIQCPPQLWG